MTTPPDEKTALLAQGFDAQSGLLTLRGPLVSLRTSLDALFREWAGEVEAEEYAFPPLLSVRSLALAEYFQAFPHLATLATRIEPGDGGVERFVRSQPRDPFEEIAPECLAAARFVLPSAACYAVYAHFQDTVLSDRLVVTVVAPCFRHEESYSAGRRQWAFSMREIVCLGPEPAVTAFLQHYRTRITAKLHEAGLPHRIAEATDPFFNKRDPRRVMQKLSPVKHEILYRDTLAIASFNFHRTFFGDRFRIRTPSGEPVYSGCVAFGLERWLSACLQEYGARLEQWPAALRPRI
jgi:seryl-tRNA synthetase